MDKTGICGLYNYGNTCYMNSALQVLRNIPEFATIFASAAKPVAESKPLLAAYSTLTNNMNNVTAPARCHPRSFLGELRTAVTGTVYEEFAQRVPHDAHEFIMYLCDKLGEAMKCDLPAPIPTTPPQWYDAVKKDYNPLLALTTGLDKITCTCLNCGNVTARWETFSMLKVPVHDVEPATSIAARLQEERQPIIVDGYTCDECNKDPALLATTDKKVKIERSIWKLPLILFITLDRFRDPMRKVAGSISANALVDVSLAAVTAAESDDESIQYIYSPIGIIDHHGSLRGGHYNCQVQQKNGIWYMYDDEYATVLTDGPVFGNSTYIICLQGRERTASEEL